ncbi:MAG: IS66 family insertion sequence element accessory protein TnpA [Lachnospiraceae bacterium]
MESTALIAAQYRLQEWAQQIKECNNRPKGMKVVEWCANNGITKANYYYRLKRVRKAYMASVANNDTESPIVSVPVKAMASEPVPGSGQLNQNSLPTLEVSANGFSVKVSEATSMELLTKVLKVVAHA